MIYREIDGDLIQLAKEGKFDVIAHGCNCFCRMKRGIAPQMVKAFGVNKYFSERQIVAGDINKLGTIDWECNTDYYDNLFVINAYTQYHWDSRGKPLDYDALRLCMRKINHSFRGKKIGLPRIGAGLAGGDWERIKVIIQTHLKDCEVTIVNYVEQKTTK